MHKSEKPEETGPDQSVYLSTVDIGVDNSLLWGLSGALYNV